MDKIRLMMSIEEIDVTLYALSGLPYSASAPVIESIKMQLVQRDRLRQEAEAAAQESGRTAGA